MLVRKKNGHLCFCINLQKFNSLTVNDAYSIPRIQDTLDCLQGAVWLTLLDVKSGYWQVELEEASKALTTFTVGPLRFYEYEQMPFGLTNTLATFKCLTETCLVTCSVSGVSFTLMMSSFFLGPQGITWRGYMQYFHGCEKLDWSYNPWNVNFFKTRVIYLGHELSRKEFELMIARLKCQHECPGHHIPCYMIC